MNWFQRWYEWFWIRYINRQPSPLCQEVLRLLENRQGWKFERYHILHLESGLAIWVANEDYGIKLIVGAKLCNNQIDTLGCQEINPPWRDKKALYHAIHMQADLARDLYWNLKKYK